MPQFKLAFFPLLLFIFSGAIKTAERVPAPLPTNPSDWTWNGGEAGHPPKPGIPMDVIFDEAQDKWFVMGRAWGDNVHQYLYTSPNGLDTWTAAPGNPVISYDNGWSIKEKDYYWQMPNYGRTPDGSLKKWNGKFVVVGVNFDGMDTHPQSLTSDDGYAWGNRTDISGTTGPVGSGDRGEIWPTQLIYNPDDGNWYFFYHGGGAYVSGRGRTIGVAKGTAPSNLTSFPGSFEHDGRISQSALVLRDSEGWKMIFQHGSGDTDGLWYATSTGGLEPSSWTAQGKLTADHRPNLRSWAVVDNKDGTVTWRLYSTRNGEKGVWVAVSSKSDALRPSTLQEQEAREN